MRRLKYKLIGTGIMLFLLLLIMRVFVGRAFIRDFMQAAAKSSSQNHSYFIV